MIAKETTSKTKSKPIEPGMYPAVCYAAIDRGTHHDEKFDKDKRELSLIFEVPDVRIEIEKDGITKSLPRAISKTYTLSLHEKAKLRKDLQSWRGRAFTADELKGFELENVVGKPCLLNITQNGEYSNIDGINPLMKGMEAPKQEHDSTYFTFDKCEDGIEPAWPEGMPQWLIDIAKESDEYRSIIASVQAGSSEYNTVASDPVIGNEEQDKTDCPF